MHDLTISGNLMCHASGGAALAQNPGGAALAQNPGGAALAQNPGGAAVTQNPGTWVTGVRVQGNRLNGFTAADGFRVPARRDGNVSGLAACS